MIYAIIEASGKQVWVQPGKFYDLNYIDADPGDIIKFNHVLLVNEKGKILVGNPCLRSTYIKAKVLKHLRGSKVTVFKMKSKKNTRLKTGYRQKLTRLLIQEIIS
uniref:Large ribosomal subunit protein bL21c n=1 Tax=Halymenia maculata TaxID=159591 RepID=A0A6G6YCI0_9FLOR|nr:ribosomal protein L21 [Halymenia maculata]QIG87236.1 ribosomal protein L21 [Halymenia maculata]